MMSKNLLKIAPMSSTDFGYQDVSYDEKTAKVDEVFDKVSPYYDLMNDLMSLGLHRRWKAQFAQLVSPRPGDKICDLASGSGDISLALLEKAIQLEIALSDPCQSMLKHARIKLARKGAFRKNAACKITFHQLWAEDLSTLGDNCFDKVVCSFGFRNMTHKDKALQEIYRILKPGGQFHMLEFSQVKGLMRYPYEVYRDKLLPQIGHFVADTQSYEYLAQSIDVFWDRQTVEQNFLKTGFTHIKKEDFTQGVCCYFSGQK